jgi:hypothetical protein
MVATPPEGTPIPPPKLRTGALHLAEGGTLASLKQCVQGRWQPRRFAAGMGIPLTRGRNSILPGTYEITNQSKDYGQNARRKNLADPWFIRAWAETVLLVKPGKKLLSHKHLEFFRFYGDWHLLRKCHTLRGARCLAGLAITSPARVFSYLGRSLCGLAEYAPDQLRQLRVCWRACKAGNHYHTGRTNQQSLIVGWNSNRKKRQSLTRSVTRTLKAIKLPSDDGQSTERQRRRRLVLRDSTREATAHNLMCGPVTRGDRFNLYSRNWKT